MNVYLILYTGTKTLFKVSPSSESVIPQNNLHIASNGQLMFVVISDISGI